MKVYPYRDGIRSIGSTLPYYADSARRLKRSRKPLFIILCSALVIASLLPAAAHQLNQNIFEKPAAQEEPAASDLSENSRTNETNQSMSATQNLSADTEAEVTSENNTSSGSSSTSVKVQVSQNSQGSSTEPAENNSSVTINGEHIEIPENGRINERIRDGDSDTRIRARVDSDSSGSSSINISTRESVESNND